MLISTKAGRVAQTFYLASYHIVEIGLYIALKILKKMNKSKYFNVPPVWYYFQNVT